MAPVTDRARAVSDQKLLNASQRAARGNRQAYKSAKKNAKAAAKLLAVNPGAAAAVINRSRPISGREPAAAAQGESEGSQAALKSAQKAAKTLVKRHKAENAAEGFDHSAAIEAAAVAAYMKHLYPDAYMKPLDPEVQDA